MIKAILKYIAECEVILMEAPKGTVHLAVALLMFVTSVASVTLFILLSAIARLLL